MENVNYSTLLKDACLSIIRGTGKFSVEKYEIGLNESKKLLQNGKLVNEQIQIHYENSEVLEEECKYTFEKNENRWSKNMKKIVYIGYKIIDDLRKPSMNDIEKVYCEINIINAINYCLENNYHLIFYVCLSMESETEAITKVNEIKEKVILNIINEKMPLIEENVFEN